MIGNTAVVAALRETELFRGLKSTALDTLAARSVERHLSAGEILFVEGAPAKHLFVIVSGDLRAFRTGPDGREQTIHVEHAGSTIGEVPVFDDGRYPSTVAAEGPSIVLSIARDRVLALCMEHPEIAISALRVLAARLRNCAALVETLSLREVGQRVARWLLAEAESRGKPGAEGITFELHLSREQIASRLGTVREVVSRALTRLQHEGLIVVAGRRITVPDTGRLAAYAQNGT